MTGVVLPLVGVGGTRSAEERRRQRELVRGGVQRVGAEVLPVDVRDWPEEWRDAWEERAGIMAFCGGLPVEEAERCAEERVRIVHARVVRLESEQESSAETAPLSP